MTKEKDIKKSVDSKTKKAKPKIDYKGKLKEAEAEIVLLKTKISSLELENLENIKAFQNKAKGFANKAQLEINKHKAELSKKLEKETTHIKKYGSQKMLESILEPISNIELAIHTGKTNEVVKGYVIGFEMLLDQFYNELSMFGLTKIVPKIGKEFNPELHHAISTKNDKKNKNKIIEVKKNGFKYHDRVIKPATVVIGK